MAYPLFDSDCVARLFERLQVHWRDTPNYKGMYRPSYSREENAAIAIVVSEATRIGMECYADLAGNVYMILAGSNPKAKAIVTGSHLDAVPEGGAYDGPAGVVGPLAMCSAMKKQGITPPQDIVVMAIRGEESPWFSQVSIGSKLAIGDFPMEKLPQLTHREDGRLLSEHMEDCGVDVRKLKQVGALFPAAQTAAFIEIHIEQGPKLHQQQVQIGVVTSIRGNVRIPRVLIQGEGGHTGAVPMELRRDAVRAAARFITRFEDGCETLIKQGYDLVYTIPVISMGPGASPTSIPKECSFYLEGRTDSVQTQSDLSDMVGRLRQGIEKDYSVSITLDKPMISKPAIMNKNIQTQLADIADSKHISYLPIASGAGHDAAVFANAGIASGMIFISHEGNSHRPDEVMPMKNFAAAVTVLAQLCMDGVHGATETDQSFAQALVAREAEPIMTHDDATAFAN